MLSRPIVLLLCVLSVSATGEAADLDKDLRKAAEKGDLAKVHQLLSKGADVNAKDDKGVTALMLAAEKAHAEIVQALLDAGADLLAKDKYGKTAVMYAALYGRAPKVVQLLLDSGSEFNTTDRVGESVWRTLPSEVRELLYRGERKREFLMAVRSGDLHAVKSVIDKGVDANTKFKGQKTALMFASESGRIDIIGALVEMKANVNAQSEDGQTALMLAAASDSSNVVSVLLEAGADASVEDKNGRTALMLAQEQGRHDNARLLLRAGINQKFLLAVSRKDRDAVMKALTSEGADVNAKNKDGRTALMLAVLGGDLEIVNALLAKAADAHIKDRDGITALGFAVQNNLLSIVQVLLSREVNMSTKQQEAWSCFGIAEREGYREIAQILESILQPQVAEGSSIHWLWKRSKPVDSIANLGSVSVWRIEGSAESGGRGMDALMAKLYGGDKTARELSGQSQLMSSLFGGVLSPRKKIATGYLEWSLFPNVKEDFLKLEQGRIELGNGASVPAPVTFSRHSDEVHLFNQGNNSLFAVFEPSLYVQSDSDFLGLSGTVTLVEMSGTSIKQRNVPVKHSDVAITGRVRFPENKWTLVRTDLRIKGGGLNFEPQGISFLPGTKILRDPNGKVGYTVNLKQDHHSGKSGRREGFSELPSARGLVPLFRKT